MTIASTIAALESVYGPFGSESGFTESALQQCEHRLATKLPHALRTLYVRTGRHAFHRACDRLVAPEDLAFDGDYLVFYEQGQRSLVWAVARHDLALDDPRVWALYDDEVLADSSTVSDFLAFEASAQAIDGGALPFFGLLDPYEETLSPPAFDRVGELLANTRHGVVRYRTGAIALYRSEGGGFVGLAAARESVFHQVAKEIGIPIDRWTISSFAP